jgi:serine/threonine-protein kinase
MVSRGPSFEPTLGFRQGDVLAGKYRVEKVIGSGGMGVVLAAHHVHLDERVAIKFLLPEALVDPTVVGRFAREARSAIKIKSEHAVRVYDVGILDSGLPYMVMEFLDGLNLAEWIGQRGPLSVEDTVDFVLQACEALAEAHGLGMVHRDLKPSNLFVVRGADGLQSVKLLDFGISKVTAPGGPGVDFTMTKPDAVLGSPLYMSPEQMTSSSSVDLRSDIWSIGVVIYELLTGKRPFNGDTLPEVCIKVSTQEPPTLSSLRPNAPAGLEAVVRRCLTKDRERRYRNVAELAQALAPFGQARAAASAERIARLIQHSGQLTPVQGRTPHAAASAGTTSTWARTQAPLGGKRAIVGWAAFLLAAVAVVFAVTRRSRNPADGGTEPTIVLTAAAPSEPQSTALPRGAVDEAPLGAAVVKPQDTHAGDGPPNAARVDAGIASGPNRATRKPASKPPTVPAAPAPAAAPDCDPPFTIDSAGVKQPKAECL